MVGSYAPTLRSGAALLSLFLCLTMCAPLALAQSTSSGTVSGVVTDQSGAIVPGANVTLGSVATNAKQSLTTNEAGRFIFVNVEPGAYNVTVSKQGFAQAKVDAQTVNIGTVTTINVQLKVGAATETVTVEASGARLQTMNATVGNTVTFMNLMELPNLGRDASTLVELQPATTPNGSVAGAVRDQNTFQLDGGNNTNDMDGTMNTYTPSYASNGAPTGVMPTPVESIEEFKVNTNNQTADFNGASGAQIQMVTRRGGQTWHGAAYEYYLGSNFFANDWANGHIPTLVNGVAVKNSTKLVSKHQNRFGASGGGPLGPSILGGKTYIFMNYEGRRYPNVAQVNKTVPSALLRAGVIQAQVGSGSAATFQFFNLNPTPVTVNGVTYQPAVCSGGGSCDPRGIGLNPIVSQIWQKYMPLPTNSDVGDGRNTGGYLASISLPQNDDVGVTRLDHDFGANWHLMASYRYYRLTRATTDQYDIGGAISGGSLGQAVSLSNRPQHPSYYVLGLTTNVSHNVTNNFNFSYLRNWWQWITHAGQAQPISGGALGGALEIGGESTAALIPYNVNTQSARQRFWDGMDYTWRDDVTWIKGNHILQFGGIYERNFQYHQRNDNGQGIMNSTVYQIATNNGLSLVANNRPANVTSASTWDTFYTEVLGIVSQPQSLYTRAGNDLHLLPLGTPAFDQDITPIYNVYFGDTWHMKPRFTLSYGLGYTIEMPPYEVDGKQVLLVDSSGSPIRTLDYLANRKQAALAGQVYDPTIGFALIGNASGKPKYPYNPYYGGLSPRVAIAWNPSFDNGILGTLVGSGKTVVRGGWGRQFGRLNGVNNVLVPLLGTGLMQAVTCAGAVNAANVVAGSQCLGSGGATASTAFRIGTDGLVAPLPQPGTAAIPNLLPQPYLPATINPAGGRYASAGSGSVIDPTYKPNKIDSFDLTIQRELSSKTVLEVGYIGRLIRNEFQEYDIDNVPYMTTLGGQSFDKAYAYLYTTICGMNTTVCTTSTIPTLTAQPFFEAAMGGPASAYCTGFANCTTAVATRQLSNIRSNLVYSMWNGLSNPGTTLGGWTLGRTLPSSNPAVTNCLATSPVCNQLDAIYTNMSNGYGNYNALFATFSVRDWHGVTGRANYTWGRALGTGSTTQSTSSYATLDPWDLHSMYGPQSFDIKHLVNASLTWHPKFYNGQNAILRHLVQGWGFAPLFNAQSGNPKFVNINTGTNQDCQSFGEMNCSTGSTNENAPFIGTYTGSPSLVYNSSPASGAGVNANTNCAISCGGGLHMNMFSDPNAVYSQFRRLILGVDHNGGGQGRIRDFPLWNLDLSVTKQIKFTERVEATWYGLFTNVLNHFQPSSPTGNNFSIDGPAAFGVVTAQSTLYPSRQIEFGLRINF